MFYTFCWLQDEGYFTLQDLKGSKLAGSVFNILFNLNKFMAFETRDPFLIRQVHTLSPVDRSVKTYTYTSCWVNMGTFNSEIGQVGSNLFLSGVSIFLFCYEDSVTIKILNLLHYHQTSFQIPMQMPRITIPSLSVHVPLHHPQLCISMPFLCHEES